MQKPTFRIYELSNVMTALAFYIELCNGIIQSTISILSSLKQFFVFLGSFCFLN